MSSDTKNMVNTKPLVRDVCLFVFNAMPVSGEKKHTADIDYIKGPMKLKYIFLNISIVNF